eukprot:s294_g8.t1
MRRDARQIGSFENIVFEHPSKFGCELTSTDSITRLAEQQANREVEMKKHQQQVQQVNQSLLEVQKMLQMSYAQEKATGGGICQVCRTVDRLACLVRSPYVPKASEGALLGHLRDWVAVVQDLGELTRGVVPNPVGIAPLPAPVGPAGPPAAPVPPPPGAGVDLPPAGCSAKAPPGVPPSVPSPGPAGEGTPKTEETEPVKKEPASSSRPSPDKKKHKRRHSSPTKQESRKSKRRSRSGRTPRKSPLPRLASPVRPAGVKPERSESDDREELPRRRAKPRSPSYSPPRRREARESGGPHPERSRWEGPIPAYRREPAPGQGKHYQKNKGVRRPAAVVAAPRRVLRRPAARIPPAGEGGEEIDTSTITLDQCRELKEVLIVDGNYWEEKVVAALVVKEVFLREGDLYLRAQVQGTQSEGFLKAVTDFRDRMVEVHLCREGCTGLPHVEGVVHAWKLKKIGARKDGWMTNLVPGEGDRRPEDEMAELREDRERLGGLPGEGRGDIRRRSPSQKKKTKKRSRSRRRQRRAPLKVEPRKGLEAIYKNTGADPDPAIRRRFRKKASKIARRKRAQSSSSGSTSSETSASREMGDSTLFGSASKVQTIGRRLPGTLAAAAVEEAAEALVTQEGGLWEVDTGPLPPLLVRYFKQQLAGRMSPAMARETQTLCQAVDYLLRGKCVETLDLLSQRIKALEMQSGGVHYTVAQQQELLPRELTSISTTPEYQEAARRAREEGKARLDASKPYGARSMGSNKGDDWSKGAGKKGQTKGKTPKGETRKGDPDKSDGKKAKGG